MKNSRLILAIASFLLPIVATSLWFYSGLPGTQSAPLPDFPSIDMPIPPLSTPLPDETPPDSVKTSILIDLKHGNQITLTEIAPIIRNLESAGAEIQVYREDSDLETRLKSVSSIISVAPMAIYSSDELHTLTNFVARGGRLVVITDPTRNTLFSESGITLMSGVDVANLLLEPFNLAFNDDYLYNMVENEGNFRNIILNKFATDSIMKDIDQLVLYGSHSMKSNGRLLATVSGETRSSSNDLAAALSPITLTKYGKGQVLAIGDISFLTSQYIQSADNQIFARNLANFVTNTNKEKTLADFPVIFEEKVFIQPVGSLKVNGDLISALSTLEKTIATKPGNLEISSTIPENVDRLVLSTFKSEKETELVLTNLGIDLAPPLPKLDQETTPIENSTNILPDITATPSVQIELTAETEVPPFNFDNTQIQVDKISLPGIGVVETNGLGVVGLQYIGQHSTLIIMASDQEKIIELINLLSTENLNPCLIQYNVAACRITTDNSQPVG